MDRLRTSVLGLYEYYVRPHVGNILSDGIDNIKPYLDKVIPTE